MSEEEAVPAIPTIPIAVSVSPFSDEDHLDPHYILERLRELEQENERGRERERESLEVVVEVVIVVQDMKVALHLEIVKFRHF